MFAFQDRRPHWWLQRWHLLAMHEARSRLSALIFGETSWALRFDDLWLQDVAIFHARLASGTEGLVRQSTVYEGRVRAQVSQHMFLLDILVDWLQCSIDAC